MDNRFIELLTKQLSDALTDAEQHELDLLLKNEPAYRQQKEILTEFWNRDQLEFKANSVVFKKVLDKIQAEEANNPSNVVTSYGKPKNNVIRYSAAAALLVFVLAAYFYIKLYKSNNATLTRTWQQKSTRSGQKIIITLSDGTMVTLNSATEFKYPSGFGGATREVYLNGEAYFDVHKDHQHPFIIHTSKMNIRVLGTAFNIKSYQDEQSSETTLIRGSIEVTLNDRPSDRIILKPKEKLIVQNNISFKIPADKPTDNTLAHTTRKSTQYALTNLTYFPNNAKNDSSVVETSWMHNKLVFRNQDFESLATEMEHWYGVRIVFNKASLKNLRFTAVFENETVVQALDALRYTEDFHYRIKNSMIYIY